MPHRVGDSALAQQHAASRAMPTMRSRQSHAIGRLRGATRRLGQAVVLASLLSTLVGCSVLGPWGGGVFAPCDAQIDRGVLPEWARAGFSDAQPRMAHVLGRDGRIVAILFGDPLSAPPAKDHNNKILWVAKEMGGGASDLSIAAQRMDGSIAVGAVVERSVPGGPGPSIIDLPSPGCWRLSLSWDGESDTLDLEYAPPGPAASL